MPQLTQARREGRICEVHLDPLLEVRAFFDIGVADATSIWLAQFSGGAIHVIDYIEGVSQPLSYVSAALLLRQRAAGEGL